MNQLGASLSDVHAWQDANSAEVRQRENEEALESEMELLTIKLGKQTQALLQAKMKELDVKFATQETALHKQETSFKNLDAAFKSEIAKLQKQVSDLG